jgi:hypothetical protein
MKYNNTTHIPHPGDTTAIFLDLLKHHLIHNGQKMGRVDPVKAKITGIMITQNQNQKKYRNEFKNQPRIIHSNQLIPKPPYCSTDPSIIGYKTVNRWAEMAKEKPRCITFERHPQKMKMN